MQIRTAERLNAKSGKTRRLVVFLHGYGADGHDLIGLGREWSEVLPDTAFVSPHAPYPCSMGGGGREWFPLTFRDPHERWRGVQHASPGLQAFLDQELADQNVSDQNLALVGFSQGAMMALHTGLSRDKSLAAIVGFSGMLVLEQGKKPLDYKQHIVTTPPVFLSHGTDDEVIPAMALFASANALAECDVPCQWHLSPQMGHGIDGEGLRQAGLFLKQAIIR